MWQFFGLKYGLDSRSDSLDILMEKASHVCTMNKEDFDAYTIRISGHADPYSYNLCAAAGYVHALLSVGYGLDTKDTPIRVVQKINGNDASWQYGAMIYEINRLGWSYGGPSGTDASQGTIMALSSF